MKIHQFACAAGDERYACRLAKKALTHHCTHSRPGSWCRASGSVRFDACDLEERHSGPAQKQGQVVNADFRGGCGAVA